MLSSPNRTTFFAYSAQHFQYIRGHTLFLHLVGRSTLQPGGEGDQHRKNVHKNLILDFIFQDYFTTKSNALEAFRDP